MSTPIRPRTTVHVFAALSPAAVVIAALLTACSPHTSGTSTASDATGRSTDADTIDAPQPAAPGIERLGHGYVRDGGVIRYVGGGVTGEPDVTRIDAPSGYTRQGFEQALGRRLTLPESIDAQRFEALSDSYTRDADSVYYTWVSPGRFLVVEMRGADPSSFRVLNVAYAADDGTVWYADTPVAGADPATFEIVERRTAKDSAGVYVSGQRVAHLDAATFEHLSSGYFADANGVYWGTEPVVGADRATFEVVEGSFIARDASRMYRSGEVMEGFTTSTRLLLDDPYGYQIVADREGVYVNRLRFLHADPDDFVVRDNRAATGGPYLFVVDTYHSTPVTVYRGDAGLVVETVLYNRRSGGALAVVRADLTDRGMERIALSPPPGADAAYAVPRWQMEVFTRPELAETLREKADAYLR